MRDTSIPSKIHLEHSFPRRFVPQPWALPRLRLHRGDPKPQEQRPWTRWARWAMGFLRRSPDPVVNGGSDLELGVFIYSPKKMGSQLELYLEFCTHLIVDSWLYTSTQWNEILHDITMQRQYVFGHGPVTAKSVERLPCLRSTEWVAI